jgi:hypothetical protein
MNHVPEKSAKEVFTEFLSTAPSLTEIAEYRLPEEAQTRAHALLDKNRTRTLTSKEQREMEEFRLIDHLLTLVKANHE